MMGVWIANQVLARGTLVLLVAFVVTVVLRRSSASVRHGVWLLAVGALVLGPLLGGWQPTTGSSEALGAPRSSGPPSLQPAVLLVAEAMGRTSTLSGPPPAAPRLPPLSVPDEWIWIWAGGALLLLFRLFRHVRMARALGAEARPPGPELEAAFRRIRDEICPGRGVSVGVHEDVDTPVVLGTSRPVVLLPPAAAIWPEERLGSALRHELAHVVRRDYLLHLVCGVVFALYWATPMAWVGRRLLARERERACDEKVLAWGTRPTDYARHLVEVARDAGVRGWRPATALVGRSGLGRRVRTVLARKAPPPWHRRTWVLGGLVAVRVTGLLSSCGPFQTRREARRAEALESLVSRDPETRRRGAWMLGELESARDVVVLEDALGDEVAAVRTAAAWALGEIKDPASGPALAELLGDPDPRVREMAALSIGEIGDPAGVAALRAALARHDDLEGAMRWALSEIGGASLLDEEGLLGADRELPDRAVWAGRLGPDRGPGARSLADLMEELEAASVRRRQAAAIALGRLGSEAAVGALLDALEDEAPEVRAAAVWALDEINPSRSERLLR
jgi:beta-lactamase regulating signal transducer with metallopeptidase domain